MTAISFLPLTSRETLKYLHIAKIVHKDVAEKFFYLSLTRALSFLFNGKSLIHARRVIPFGHIHDKEAPRRLQRMGVVTKMRECSDSDNQCAQKNKAS